MSTSTGMKAIKCSDCGFISPPPMSACSSCGSDGVAEVELSGKGRIYTYTVVHMGFGALKDRTPYVLAVVELDEGVKMTTVVEEMDVNAVQVGDAVTYHHTEENIGPIFRPT